MAQFRYNNDLVIVPEEMMEYIDEMGAISIKEAKTRFATSSQAVRHVIADLLKSDEIILTAHAGGIYLLRRTGERGKPNVKKLRAEAGVAPRTRRSKQDLTSESPVPKSPTHPGYKHKKLSVDDPFEA